MAGIPLKDLVKIRPLVQRIESGRFDANDVDLLLIKLRPYAENRTVFREISDFVAHTNARNKGVTCDSMTGFADAMRFFVEYVGPKRTLDLSAPFPSYVYRLFRSQTVLANAPELTRRFRQSPQTLLRKIESNFKVERAARLCHLRPGKHGAEFIAALKYVTGFIHSKPAFDLADFHTQLRDVLRARDVQFNESALAAQTDRVSLALLCLLSGTEFTFPDGEIARCTLATESHYRILEGKRRTPIGVVTSDPSALGHLQIWGNVNVVSDGKQLTVAYPVITTNLDPHEHCAESLFQTLSEENEFGTFRAEFINLEPHMAMTSSFQLIPAAVK
jgi:hypothetical protein